MGLAAQLHKAQRRRVRGNEVITPPRPKPMFQNKPGKALLWLLKSRFGVKTCSRCFRANCDLMDEAGVVECLAGAFGNAAGIYHEADENRRFKHSERILKFAHSEPNFAALVRLVREACDLASYGTEAKRHPSLAQPATFVWLFVQSASDSSPKGEELRFSMRSVKANYNGDSSFVLIGDIPDWYHGPAIPRKRQHFDNRPKYRDTIAAIREACESDLVPAEWIWMDDDTYFTRPVTLDDLKTTRYQGTYPMLPGGGFQHAEVKADTVSILRSQGVHAMDTATHLPQVFESDKWLAMYRKYGLDHRALIHEMLYSSEYGTTGARRYETNYFHRITVDGDTDLSAHIVNNSVGGWSNALHAELRSRFQTPTLHESFVIRSRGRSLDLLDGETTAVQRIVRKDGFHTYEPETVRTLQEAWERAPAGFTFLDIGANCGLYACLCKLQRPDARVIAFEPAPETMAIAQRIARHNKLDIEWSDIAISDKCGEATFYLSAKSDASNSLRAGFRPAKDEIKVRTETLDCYCDKHHLVPHVIKMDVEDLEPEVLRGGRKTIETLRPMIVSELQIGDDLRRLTDELPDFYQSQFLEAIHTRENHLFTAA